MILHISNDYSGSTVYKNLVGKLDELNLEQIVYSPVRSATLIGKNKIDLETKNSEIIYASILSKYTDRIFYRKKIKKISKDIELKIDLTKVSFIHAHTWYSDGGVAYKLYKKHGIPYIVTVRSTDLNLFQKYLIHERTFGRLILANAHKVVLISASYKERLLQQKSLESITDELNNKIELIPNGVDDFWVDNAVFNKRQLKTPVQILFVGKFIKRKNVIPLQKAIEEINKDTQLVQLHLIGGGGRAQKQVLENVSKNSKTMFYYGKIINKSQLKSYFEKSHIFAMPSKSETFGLVYVEAMLQGLPVLYTHNEGIDGFYTEEIGEKVYSSKVSVIKQKLLTLIDNYPSYDIPTKKLIKNHSWSNIAKVYQSLYNCY